MLCDREDVVKKYKEQAAEFICGKYNWDDVTKRTVDLYQKK